MAYTTAAQDAAEIRQTLKSKLGATSRDVSVRSSSYSMGSSIHVTVKNPAFNAREVAAVANEKEKIDRDERTGEILSGGNRFVSVSYSEKALASFACGVITALEIAIRQLEGSDSRNLLVPVGSSPVLVGHSQGYGYQLWHRDLSGPIGHCFSHANHGASIAGIALTFGPEAVKF